MLSSILTSDAKKKLPGADSTFSYMFFIASSDIV